MDGLQSKDLNRQTPERNAFLTELRQFHQSRGAPFRRPPCINGRYVDLQKLYNEVTSLGGWMKITDLTKWNEILLRLGFSKNCANGPMLLKHIYIRFLDKYEKIHFFGEEGDEVPAESRSGRKSYAYLASTVPTCYFQHQHEVSDQMRAISGMSQDRYIPSGYDKLLLSLSSGLPNEVDLALNVVTILSNEGQHVLQLPKIPKIVDILLGHAGIYAEADRGLKMVIDERFAEASDCGGNLSQFWIDTIDKSNAEMMQILSDNICNESNISKLMDDEFDNEELFSINRSLGLNDREGQRVLRIALILHNLSFEPPNATILAGNNKMVRFLLLCSNCKWSDLKRVGLDTFGNIAGKISLEHSDHIITNLVLGTVIEAIVSQDRFLVMRGLEIISKLCQVEGNDEALFGALNSQVYTSMCNYLTVKDVCLLISTLEALFQLTELGEQPCSGIAGVHKSVEILMNLLTIDPLQYGKEGLQGMKLVTVREPIVEDKDTATSTSVHTTVTSQTSQNTPQRTNFQPVIRQFNAAVTQRSNVAIIEQDPESFATTWLKTYFEPDVNSSVPKLDMYNEFLSYTHRSGRKSGVPNPNSFNNCVRMVFPKSSEKRSETGGELVFYHDGIKKKSLIALSQHQLCVTLPPSPTRTPPPNSNPSHSPILKAHLSTPTIGLNSPAESPTTKSKSALKQALFGGTKQNLIATNKGTAVKTKDNNNTTLIKSLLASKVNRNIHQKQLQHEIPIIINQNELIVNSGKEEINDFSSKVKRRKLKSETTIKSKTAALLAAKLNGVQKPVVDALRLENAIELDENLTQKLIDFQPNGRTGSDDIKSGDACDKLIHSVTQCLPELANKEVELKRREKICKSSPLLNGLLDKGTLSEDVVDEKRSKLVEPKKSSNHLQNGEKDEKVVSNLTNNKFVSNNSNGNVTNVNNVVINEVIPSIKYPAIISQPQMTTLVSSTPVVTTTQRTLSAILLTNVSTSTTIPLVTTPLIVSSVLFPAVTTEQNSDSNMSGSDLSSLSEIARTVESASVVLNQNSAAVETLNTQKDGKDASKVINQCKISLPSSVSNDNNVVYSNICLKLTPVIKTNVVATVNKNVQQPPQSSSSSSSPQSLDQVNISNPNLKNKLKRPIAPLPSNVQTPEPKKSRIECSNIIKLEESSNASGILIIQNGVLQEAEDVTTIKTGIQNNAPSEIVQATKVLVNDKKVTNRNSAKSKPDDKKKKEKCSGVMAGMVTENTKLEYTCEWQGCGRMFDTTIAIYLHACDVHAPLVSDSNSIPCLWENCDKQPRRRFSLMTHFQDRHCSEQILKINALRKQQIAKMGKATIALPQMPPAHPGYPPNAAFHAIRRHALQFVCDSDVVNETNEDVMAKSVRLSAALILRNLARYSALGKKRVRVYETKISLLASSKVEASRALSQCLAALISTDTR